MPNLGFQQRIERIGPSDHDAGGCDAMLLPHRHQFGIGRQTQPNGRFERKNRSGFLSTPIGRGNDHGSHNEKNRRAAR